MNNIDKERVDLIMKASVYAAEMHKHQRRKDGTDTPYINHCLNVGKYVNAHTKANFSDRTEIVTAAILHDVVEDTPATLDSILYKFGQNVKGFVEEVTDDKSLPKHIRKKLQVLNAGKKSYGAKMIKLADKLDNLKSFSNTIPEGWDVERVQGYFVWSWFVVNSIRGVSNSLAYELDKVFDGTFKMGDQVYDSLPVRNTDGSKVTAEQLLPYLDRYYASMEKVQE